MATGILTTIRVGTTVPLKSGSGTLRQGAVGHCCRAMPSAEGTHVVFPASSSKRPEFKKLFPPKLSHIKKLSQSGAHVMYIIANISAVGQVGGAVALYFFSFGYALE